MKIRTTLATIALVLLPGMAAAWECGSKAAETASLSCATGQVFDDMRGICVVKPTS